MKARCIDCGMIYDKMSETEERCPYCQEMYEDRKRKEEFRKLIQEKIAREMRIKEEQKREERSWLCSKRCKTCKYSSEMFVGNRGKKKEVAVCCIYILEERKRRGCPAGDRCTKYVKGKRRKNEDFEQI